MTDRELLEQLARHRSEDAQKRVSRALDRLRDIFTKRCVTLSATALAATISGSAVQAAPAVILATISSAAVGAGLTAAVTTATFNTASTMTTLFNLKTTAAIIATAAVAGGSTYLVKENQVEQLRTEQTVMAADNAQLLSDQQNAIAKLEVRDRRVEQLAKDVDDVHRLRGEVDRLNRELNAMETLQSENLRLAATVEALQERLRAIASNPVEEQRQERTQFVATRIGHVNNLKLLALVTRIYANNHEESYPDNWNDPGFLEALSQATAGQNSLTDDYNPNHYEQVYFGKDPSDPSIVVIRQRDPMVDPNGNQWNLYATANGAVHSIREEQVGSFEQFEQNWTLRREPFVFEQSQR